DAYTDLKLSTNASTDSCQLVKISQSWIAFKQQSGVGSVGILPVGPAGRVGQNVYSLNAHGSNVSDWEFSPFDANLLITGAENGEVKVWQISSNDKGLATSQLLLTIVTGTGKAIETIAHHPTAQGIIATASQSLVQIWNISGHEHGSTLSTPAYALTHPNKVYSLSWKADGIQLATTCKDTQIRVFNPRENESPIQTGQGPVGSRSSRIVWIGEKDLLFTVGFNNMREREIALWKADDLSKPLELKHKDSSNGFILPLYDEDTSIMFLPSRGETMIHWVEIADSAPYMTEGTGFTVPAPVAGAGLVPKQILNVMQTEVARILVVNNNSLWPVSVNVPRRSYLDFHADLYPETKSTTPGLEAPEWLQGENRTVPRVSLDPGMAGKPAWAQQAVKSISSNPTSASASTSTSTQASSVPSRSPAPTPPQALPTSSSTSSPKPTVSASPTTPEQLPAVDNKASEPTPSETPAVSKSSSEDVPQPATSTANVVESPPASVPKSSTSPSSSASNTTHVGSPAAVRLATHKTSKFRFLTFKPYHISQHFESISGLSISAIPECNLIEVNPKFMALPLQATGGRVGILKTTEPGRVTKVPSLVCSSDLLSFKFDPFNHNLLVTASDDAKIKGWIIPEEGLDHENDVTKPEWVLGSPTMDKISLIQFHPQAKDVLLSASMDRNDPTLRLWDLKAQKEVVTIKATNPFMNRGSQREILLYDSNDLASGPVDKKAMDNSPGVLVPHYDPDTSLLGISARGDRVMKHFEILVGIKKEDAPNKSLFVEVASLEQGTLQQDVAYLPKKYCDVRELELAKMYRLTYNSVEVIRVSVPRNKKEYFQDDLFPDTDDVESASMEAKDFFDGAGSGIQRKKISLCPSDMETLSHHIAATPATPQTGGNSLDKFLQGKQQAAEDDRKKKAMERMFETAKESKADRDTLVPDTGIVAEEEWDD
ncbi:Coronin-7, partial [Lobosporangium transversale]